MIDTLESVHDRGLRKAGSPLVYTVMLHKPVNLDALKTARSGVVIGEVEATINHGRWIVECPDPDCTGATLASETLPQFVCPYCAYGIFTVVWPNQRAGIENALDERPVKDTRNWTPTETVGDLRKENKDRLAHRRNDRKDR